MLEPGPSISPRIPPFCYRIDEGHIAFVTSEIEALLRSGHHLTMELMAVRWRRRSRRLASFDTPIAVSSGRARSR